MRIRYDSKDWHRFWSNINKGSGCWEWQGYKDGHGYGQLWVGKKMLAHRLMWMIGHDDPKELRVCHTCDNPLCVRPSHLFLGTSADNTRDSCIKGRQARKLTESMVRSIRKDRSSLREIAKVYGVDRRLIFGIKKRELWKHVV